MGYIDLAREKDILLKAEIVKSNLAILDEEYCIEKIFIEENLQAFRPGFSSAKTLMTLARFNGIVSYIHQKTWLLLENNQAVVFYLFLYHPRQVHL